MAKHLVGSDKDIRVGAMTSALAGRAPVVVTRLPTGEIRAFAARCPHQGAMLAHGCISSFTRSGKVNTLEVERTGEIVRCPWHGFEFCLITGDPAVAAPQTMPMRLRFYPVEVENDQVFVVT